MGGAVVGSPLFDGLLFCLFSLLFGLVAALVAELLRALLTSLWLLPKKESEEKISVCAAVGFFAYDVLLFTLLASLYTVFLFLVNEGVFRLYSLCLVICGFFLFRPLARGMVFPIERALSWLFSFPLLLFYSFFRCLTRKRRKRLDENGKMV